MSYQQARTIALTLLGDRVATQEAVAQAIDMAIAAVSGMPDAVPIDRDALLREVESKVRVWVGESSVLDDPRGHEEWLAARRGDIDWRLWQRYRRYLDESEGLARTAIVRTDDLTDKILGRLEDPKRPGKWDRRGLIAGQVQSGKTGNYIGLMCKAADAGYKLIIVLAGVHNSLRSQTQLRVDQGLLGFDSQRRRAGQSGGVWLGVGRLAGVERPAIHSLTNSADRGDFNTNVAQRAAVDIGGNDPVVLVIKKNVTVLNNLIDWSTTLRKQRAPDSDRDVVPGIPLLVIDDEADHASVNTADYDEAEPSRINGLIRDLLAKFEQSAYVGYTATPFANILIDPDKSHDTLDDDLFPRSFIFTLNPPSNYIGPSLVFGVREPDPDDTGHAGLPLIREVLDEEAWVPRRHRKSHIPSPPPDSFHAALRSFVLVVAARRARGQAKAHNSMLIHVTRFVDVQGRIHDQVLEELATIRQRLRYGDGESALQLRDELGELWRSDFMPVMEAIQASGLDSQALPLSWGAVEAELSAAAESIVVRRVNGTAMDALEYFEHPDGFNVIAIGGDKLSRGLTLEGLSVSYFLRASRMYDTLLQMGRWFGYRPGYLDLCRLYLSPELRSWFGTITRATSELMELFDEMADAGGTPMDFGLRIRSNADGLTVTSPAKMQRGVRVKVSYSGDISETVNFDTDPAHIAANYTTTEELIRTLQGRAGETPKSHDMKPKRWSDVDARAVLVFLGKFRTHDAARKANAKALADYIKARVAAGELTDWQVLLASISTAPKAIQLAELPVGPVVRARYGEGSDGAGSVRYDIRRLVSPTDEHVGLSQAQIGRAMTATIERWEEKRHGGGATDDAKRPEYPSGRLLRRERDPRSGLLMLYPLEPPDNVLGAPAVIGFAISFPVTESTDSAVDFVVNQRWLQEEFFKWDD